MNNEHPEVTGYEALYRSIMKCKKGVMWKDSTAHFCLNGLTEVMKLEKVVNEWNLQRTSRKDFYSIRT